LDFLNLQILELQVLEVVDSYYDNAGDSANINKNKYEKHTKATKQSAANNAAGEETAV